MERKWRLSLATAALATSLAAGLAAGLAAVPAMAHGGGGSGGGSGGHGAGGFGGGHGGFSGGSHGGAESHDGFSRGSSRGGVGNDGHHRHRPIWPCGGYPCWGFGLGLGFYDPFYDPYYGYPYDHYTPDRREQRVEGEDVEIKVHPSSAHILVNGMEYGNHGKARFRLPSGTWTVVLEAPGYEPQTIQLDMEPGRGYTIDRHLVKIHGE